MNYDQQYEAFRPEKATDVEVRFWGLYGGFRRAFGMPPEQAYFMAHIHTYEQYGWEAMTQFDVIESPVEGW